MLPSCENFKDCYFKDKSSVYVYIKIKQCFYVSKVYCMILILVQMLPKISEISTFREDFQLRLSYV